MAAAVGLMMIRRILRPSIDLLTLGVVQVARRKAIHVLVAQSTLAAAPKGRAGPQWYARTLLGDLLLDAEPEVARLISPFSVASTFERRRRGR